MFSYRTISQATTNGVKSIFKRHVSYNLPKIPLLEDLRVNQQDFKGLLSNSSLNQLWFTRGENIVKDLNELLVENQITPPNNLQELISLTINKPEFHKIYTDSSLLYNLQFFFESLKESSVAEKYEFKRLDESAFFQNPDINEPTINLPQDEQLTNWLVASFGSIGEFKNLLLNSAKAIKGDGITWLIAQPNVSELSLRSYGFNNSMSELNEPKYTKLSIMNTYNAGTVDDSIRSGQLLKLQQQKAAKEALQNEHDKDASSVEDKLSQNDNYLGSVKDAELNYLFSDKKIVPLLAIDASLRNYLLDYGVFGKAQYLENVWNCINWDTVKQRSPPRFIANFTID